MTREEAIKKFESELKWAELNIYPYVSKQKIEADNMAIKALEQEPILDKIRAEIDAQIDLHDTPFEIDNGMDVSFCNGLNKAKEIIDKYKAESEEQT